MPGPGSGPEGAARAHLAEVGHHGVDGVAQQRDAALGPRLEDRGGAVVEVTLLDLVLLRGGVSALGSVGARVRVSFRDLWGEGEG